ncbi:THO complex subunit 7 [Ranunculus cassubicifolius]
MRWHADSRTKDNIMRHPADTEAWKHLDKLYPLFGSESRNVRLGLANDEFNPFGNMSTTHSTWPIVVIPYNLPPWMCMKQPYIFMSLLIPGPSGPGNNIDVYMRPLIDELKELWIEGVETYDAYSKQNFQMRVAVLWTINDFPAYANLSGWSTKGKLACPSCYDKSSSIRLFYGRKFSYLGARQFLPVDHIFRFNKSSFDNKVETRDAPQPLTGNEVLDQLKGHSQITFGKAECNKVGQKRRRDDKPLPHNWKKISIFFELPYWKDLLLRHNLDVMHIEKNNGVSWVGTLLDMEGKTKDSMRARQDLELMGIRKSLHPKPKGGKNYTLPAARYTMDLHEKRRLPIFEGR